MSILLSGLFSLISGIPGLLNGLLTYLNKKQDNALEQFRIGNTNGKEVSIAVVQAEIARQAALKDITVNAMSHPIWWVAWGIGVFPVLTYHGCVFWVSTFPGLGWEILKVPADQAAFGNTVVQWMFGIGGASALVTSVAQSWSKRA
jgi:hypothetical protein